MPLPQDGGAGCQCACQQPTPAPLLPACSYKLNIINLVKSDSLYTSGMQPLLHSQLLHRRKGLGWHRAGTSVAYFANSIKRAGSEHYHSISFVLEGLQEGDVVHLAHCYPFTYTDLQRHLHVLMVSGRQLVLHSGLPNAPHPASSPSLLAGTSHQPPFNCPATGRPGTRAADPARAADDDPGGQRVRPADHHRAHRRRPGARAAQGGGRLWWAAGGEPVGVAVTEHWRASPASRLPGNAW